MLSRTAATKHQELKEEKLSSTNNDYISPKRKWEVLSIPFSSCLQEHHSLFFSLITEPQFIAEHTV